MPGIEAKKKKILIADNSKERRELFCRVLETEYEIIEAVDRQSVLDTLSQLGPNIALVLLTIEMHNMDDVYILRMMGRMRLVSVVPVVVVLPERDADKEHKAWELGAADCVEIGTDVCFIKNRIDNIIRLFAATEPEREAHNLESRGQYFDKLTGCLNMDGFRKGVRDIFRHHPDRQYALWVSDIKNFKLINNAFGYNEGSALLKYWSGLMMNALKEDELIARDSGDRFVALTRCQSGRDLNREFDGVREKVACFFENYRVEICSGIYMIKPHEMDMDIDYMLDLARIAQLKVKESVGGGRAFFEEEQWNRIWRNMAISNHLDEAIKNGEISVWLQPQYNYITGEIIGAEALCRWTHAELGSIMPGEFIPLLEDIGQIYKLDCFVWEQVCGLIRRWMRSGDKKPITVSINISRNDFSSMDCVEYLDHLVKKYDIPPVMLGLEITESTYMSDPKRLSVTVRKLQEKGFRVEMDDFGSGYSSLSMLNEIPVNVLKMDFKFLQGSGDVSRGGIILSSVLRMAHQLELPVICEGVETEAQADFMKNLGCRLMQGFYFSRPIPITDFEKLITAEKTGLMPEYTKGFELRNLDSLLNPGSSSAFIFDKCIGGAAIVEYHDEICDIIMANDGFYKALGIDTQPVSEAYGVNPLEYVCGDERRDVIASLEEAIAHGTSRFEFRLAKNGRWINSGCRHVSLGENGNILFMTFENVTENHEMRSRLIQLNSELEAHMRLMPGAVFSYEADGAQEFTYISESMLELLNYPTMEEFKAKFHNNFPEMVYCEDRERVLKEINDQIAEGSYDTCIYRVETGDGVLKWFYDKGHIVEGDDGKRYFYVVIVEMEGHY